MKNDLTVSEIKDIEEFKKCFYGAADLYMKGCKIYTNAIDRDETSKYEFHKACPTISHTVWGWIEAVGREQMHPILLTDSTDTARYIRKLPYSEQKKAIEVGFEVLTVKGDILKVKRENLTSQFRKQVIAKDHIRDIPAQRAYIESQKVIVKMETEKPSDLYSVKGKILHVYAPTQFTRHQLINLLQDMG